MILLDTHALVWWVSGLQPLSAKARRAVREALTRGVLHASAISLLEIATAVRRGRLALGAPVQAWFDDLSRLPELALLPVTPDVARVAGAMGDEMHGDPVDRIIVATARILDLGLVTADERLRRGGEVRCIW